MGTLVALEPPHERLRAKLHEVAGVDVSGRAAKDAFKAEIAYYLEHHLEGRDADSLDRLRDECAAVLQRSLGDVAAAIDPGVVKRAMLDAIHFDAYADAAPALRALRDGGLRLVVASNWDCSLPDALAATGLGPRLDGTITSAQAGAAKPDPSIFRAALAAAGVPASAAVHVGDSPREDVEGARAAGIEPILVLRGRGAAPPDVRTIRSLDELVELAA